MLRETLLVFHILEKSALSQTAHTFASLGLKRDLRLLWWTKSRLGRNPLANVSFFIIKGRFQHHLTEVGDCPVLVLLFGALWFILRGDLLYVLPCAILFLCFSVLLALRLPRLGERANLSAFRTFDRFVLVWICRFPLPLDVWEGLRFVIVALPGLFSYLFLPVAEI